MDSPTSGPDQLTRCVPPLNLEGLPRHADSRWNRAPPPPSTGEREPPPAPRAPEQPVSVQRAQKEGAPLAKGQPSGGGDPWEAATKHGKAEECSSEGPLVEGGSRDKDGKDPIQRPRREQEAAQPSGSYGGKEQGSTISWAELGVPINAQWIRHKHEFRNTRPW